MDYQAPHTSADSQVGYHFRHFPVVACCIHRSAIIPESEKGLLEGQMYIWVTEPGAALYLKSVMIRTLIRTHYTEFH